MSDQLLRTHRTVEQVLEQQTKQASIQAKLLAQQKSNAEQMAVFMRRVEKASEGTSVHATRTSNTWKETATAVLSIYGTMQAINALKSTVTSNLDFERDLVEMKQNAGMSKAQVEEIRKLAISAAPTTLQSPQDILMGAKSFARAGDKYSDIKGNTIEAARAATVFRASPEQIANMDFDLRTKMKVPNSEIPAVNNMLYYHGNAGRFEAPSFAQFAPEMLAAMSNVGVKGKGGINFTGALTQVLMNNASVNEPGKVKTFIEQGLGHITTPHYVKGLAKYGIDVPKYMPNGQFYGEDGTQGLLDLTEAMKKKGLTNPFKLAKAGFADQETQKFWRAMMQYSDEIRAAMKKGDLAAKNDQIGIDLKEMQDTNFGKVKKAQITTEQLKLGDAGQDVTQTAAKGAQFFSNNPITTGLLTATAGVGGYYSYLQFKNTIPQMMDDIKAGSIYKNMPDTVVQKTALGINERVPNTAKVVPEMAGLKTAAKIAGRVATPLTVGVGAYDAYDAYKDPNLTQKQKDVRYGKAAGGTAGALAGAWAGGQGGAALGTAIFPGVGTALGALLGGIGGGIGGWWIGDQAGGKITETITSSNENQVDAIKNQTDVLSRKLDTLISATNNRPAASFPGLSMQSLSNSAVTEEKRHGAIPYKLG
ncbi:phage tail tape measure protein [Acinetobacter vivianii]|uniref:phage tail tape measure protein n=1 Tax=Acinetobacter vivianii TaxID=1776742 RepID=UPI00166B1485|nr:phage tail tape measure protein [Acinetobacter vivianii]